MILFLFWTGLIILLSVIPYSREVAERSESVIRWDYLEHFLVYFAFGSLYIIWRSGRHFRISNLDFLLMFIITFSFSILTEYVQILIPGRAFNYIDVAYNLTGVLLSIIIVYFYLVRYYIRRKQSAIEVMNMKS